MDLGARQFVHLDPDLLGRWQHVDACYCYNDPLYQFEVLS